MAGGPAQILHVLAHVRARRTSSWGHPHANQCGPASVMFEYGHVMGYGKTGQTGSRERQIPKQPTNILLPCVQPRQPPQVQGRNVHALNAFARRLDGVGQLGLPRSLAWSLG